MKGEFTPLVVAREKGFFQEQGIEVDLLEGKSGTEAAQAVATGNDQFGYIPSVQVIQGINQGMPIQGLASCGRNTGMCWASHADVPLADPKALEGRKVSISTSSTFFQVWDGFARKFGVDKSKVDVVAADPSARVGLVLQRQVDIMADIFLANDFVILQNRANENLNLLKLADLDYDPIGYVLVTNRSILTNDSGLGRGFTQATLKGLEYTLRQPDEVTQIMTHLYASTLGAAVIDGQIKQLLPLVNKEPQIGKSDEAAWNHSLDILVDSAVIDKKLPLDQYFTNDFVAA
jgi:ABC-type nitrate/sulfonate/bicarbonate transport system substrate-binding protein